MCSCCGRCGRVETGRRLLVTSVAPSVDLVLVQGASPGSGLQTNIIPEPARVPDLANLQVPSARQ